jgi:hypothetical protein
MSFKIRLEKILKTYNLNAKKLGVKLGYGENPAKLYRLLNDENNSPSYQIIQDILKTFPEINAKWLVTGEEDMMILEEPRTEYGFCKQCLKLEGRIEQLEKELTAKDRRIEELLCKGAGDIGRTPGQAGEGRKAS